MYEVTVGGQKFTYKALGTRKKKDKEAGKGEK